jgi:hypothetical protein
MANIKTAISIEKTLFDQAEGIARELKMSRSSLHAEHHAPLLRFFRTSS